MASARIVHNLDEWFPQVSNMHHGTGDAVTSTEKNLRTIVELFRSASIVTATRLCRNQNVISCAVCI